MKKKILVSLLCGLFIARICSFAQSAPEVDSRKIINKGISLHDDKKYTEATAEFKKVSRNDTNYVLAATELVNTYIADGKDSLAVVLCNRLLELPSSYIPNIMTFKANALDDLKRPDDAIKVYEEGMKKFPLNYSFTYELGVLKMRQEKYKEAYDWFVKSIKVNPYHANTHFQLGLLAMKQGKLLPTMLAWQFYLTIDNSTDRAQSIVLALEKMAKNEYDFGTTVNVDALNNQDDFSEVETLVKSKVALGPKYKSETKLNFNITKQIQLIMEKMEVAKEDKGFFMQFYTPFFLEVYKNKFLESFSYSILAGMKNKDVDSWMKKNTSKVDALSNWIVDYLGKTICTYDDVLNGQTVKAQHFYSKANLILAVGNMNVKNLKTGYWNYYYSNGMKKSEGEFNDKDQRIGIWKFYSTTGLIDATENYIDGSVEGKIEAYFSNGSILSQRNFAKSLLEGEQLYYYPTGVKKTSSSYKANIENGKEGHFYRNGKLDYEVNVINAKYDGALVEYYMNGHVKQKFAFKEDKRMGKLQEFYNYPENTIKQEVNYEKGIAVGIYKSYYQNGVISETGEFDKDGEKTGVWKTFNEDNILTSEETYSNGKNAGTTKNYTNKGKLSEEFIYKNNMLQEYKAYDVTGKVTYQNKKEGKSNYDVLLYYSNGNKRREGKVKNSLLDGNWKNFNANGFLSSEENYAEGKKEGKFIAYYENGKIKSETNYVNGETDGYYREFYRNGELKKEGAYIKDKEIGIWNNYYSDGTISDIYFYKDGALDNWQQYFAANGKLDAEDFFELNYVKLRTDYDSLGKVMLESALDKGTGVLDIKYPSGKPHWKVNYQYNLKQGVFTSLYPNGKISYNRTYLDNELQGEAKYYYASGKIRAEENYINGDLNGKALTYYENGNMKSSFDYVYGKELGKSTYYYSNKQVQVEYTYKNNLLDGKSTYYNEAGDLMLIKNFEEGILISYQYNDKEGNLVVPIEIKNETGTIKAFYKTGSPSMLYTLKNGVLEGNKLMYFSDGKIFDECNFVCDERDGKRKIYFSSGKIKQIENYKSDERSGDFITYYENGKIKSEEHYINDKRFGTFKNYDEAGKLTKSYFYYDDDLLNEN